MATIARTCRYADIRIAQLHGDPARAALVDLPDDLDVIYVLQAHPDGRLRPPCRRWR